MPRLAHRPPNLQLEGPTVKVTITLPSSVVADFHAKGIPIPSEHNLLALIDTGASNTSIDVSIASKLSLIARDERTVLTPSGESKQELFDVAVVIPALHPTFRFELQVLGANLGKQPYQVLIGRDILSLMTLVYHGWDNSYTLHL